MAAAPLLTTVAAAGALTLPGVLHVGDQVLAAASCGVRETLWIDHYIATLYVRPGDAAVEAGDVVDPGIAGPVGRDVRRVDLDRIAVGRQGGLQYLSLRHARA